MGDVELHGETFGAPAVDADHVEFRQPRAWNARTVSQQLVRSAQWSRLAPSRLSASVVASGEASV
jgi:hypothetical protein